jgi:outer membrane biosynthesis protein TonB
MRIAVLVAIAIHAVVLFLVHPIARRQVVAEPGSRIDVTLAPATASPKSIASRHAARAETGGHPRQAGHTPVMTAQTEEPPAPSGPSAPQAPEANGPTPSSQTQAGSPAEPLAGAGSAGTEATHRDSANGSDQAGAGDAAAILSYVNRLAREMRRAPQRAYKSTLTRQVRVQIALDRGAPSVRLLGSSNVREFDQLSVAAANRALVAVKPPLELFDKRFRFSVCAKFNAPNEEYSAGDDDARAGKRGPDGVLEVYFEHGVRCETAVAAEDEDDPEKPPSLEPALAQYRDTLEAEVKKLWFYPSAAHRRDEGDLEGTVAVQIASQGGAPLARASYSAINRYPPLNDAAEVIARNAIAAVALPPELQGKPFRFEVSIEFKPVDY